MTSVIACQQSPQSGQIHKPGRVDDIDALLDRGADGGNRFRFVGPTHIHPPMAQVPMATRDILSDVPKISASSMFIL